MQRETRQQKRARLRSGEEGELLPALGPPPASPRPARWMLAALVAAAAVAVYWNTLGHQFVSWDDGDYVYSNPLLTGSFGAIWADLFSDKRHEQYYPLVFSSFWIEHHFVGLEPRLYHVTQMALHAANAALWIFVLRWLGVGLTASALTAALFAVHPINVASVAWVTERKNTLSGFFFLLSLLLYLQHRRGLGTWRYGASVASFLFALFAKTAVVILPALLIVSDRVLDGRWTRTSLRRAVPYLALAFLMAIITMGIEQEQSKSGRPVALALRPLIASGAIVHYFCKIVWPTGLLPLYPRWPVSFGEPRYWISLTAIVIAAVLLFRFRKKLGPLALWCAAMFVLPLAPALGLQHFNLMQYTFVADHLAYLSAPGAFLAAGLVVERILRRRDPSGRPTGMAAAILVALAAVALGPLTIRQNRVWHNGVTMWEYTLAGNPHCVPGNINLGNHYRREGQFEKALSYYREAARLMPDHINSPKSCAQCCRALGRSDEAVQYFQEAVRRAEMKSPRYFGAHIEYAGYLRKLGRRDDARAVYETILTKDPKNRAAQQGLERLSSSK